MSTSPLSAAISCGQLMTCAMTLVLAAGCHHSRASAPTRLMPAERVPIGYGVQDREDVTGSIASATGKELLERKVGRTEDLLQGRFPGVLVVPASDGSFSIRIRGVVPGGEPLYVVDGGPVQLAQGQGLSWLNPFDIERIDVLKGAAAAIYGPRAANGVILITTKRGR
jgi:TonB-dependent starch-binding outer membrane protein SusC